MRLESLYGGGGKEKKVLYKEAGEIVGFLGGED